MSVCSGHIDQAPSTMHRLPLFFTNTSVTTSIPWHSLSASSLCATCPIQTTLCRQVESPQHHNTVFMALDAASAGSLRAGHRGAAQWPPVQAAARGLVCAGVPVAAARLSQARQACHPAAAQHAGQDGSDTAVPICQQQGTRQGQTGVLWPWKLGPGRAAGTLMS